MPNIEIHDVNPRRGEILTKQIFNLLKDKLPVLVDEVVVTNHSSRVVDQYGKDQPFLRLITTEHEETGNLLRLLKTLGLDIEYLKLVSFIPKGSETS
ncbi:hypothetical protein KKG48_00240 [Patescibacteria group bacterium]|nr:hypothetical protein [Patescibacteria group bacterium]